MLRCGQIQHSGVSTLTNSKFWENNRIPTLEEEVPVLNLNGFIFSNRAYHCRHDDLWTPRPEDSLSLEGRRAIDVYLANFCRPVQSIAKEVRCVACNVNLTLPMGGDARKTMVVDSSSDTLESRCEECGYPLRCRHMIVLLAPHSPLAVVKLDFFPLCYHPSATTRAGLLM
jgi:hypothetical protein